MSFAASFADESSGFFGAGLARVIMHADDGAGLGEQKRRRAADADAGAGDQCNAAGERLS
jgi:hypothetical protein